MAQLTLPVRGRIVSLDVPRELRKTIAQDVLIQTAFMRRTGRSIASPRGFTMSLARKAISASADQRERERRLATLHEHIEIADDMSTDAEEIELGDLCRRLFLGEVEDGTFISGERWERLAKSAWYVSGHKPTFGCETCAPLFSQDSKIDSLIADTQTPEVVLRILYQEMTLALRGAMPPYWPRQAGGLIHRPRGRSIPDL